MKKSIRKYFELAGPYHSLCREERNLCAVLYHLLAGNPENLSRFLKTIGHEPAKLDTAEIYVEYAHLRDIWNAFGKGKPSGVENETRREFILDALDLQSREDLRNSSVQEFNKFFVARTSPSSKVIESPSNWSIKQLDESFPDDSVGSKGFLRAARFKWCFNVKPDIVIFLSQDEAVSIEAKFESSESKYPSGGEEWKIFQKRGLPKDSQTEIQEKVFELLGIDATHVLLVKKGGDDNQFTWTEVLRALNVDQESRFIQEQIESFLKKC